MPERCFEDLLDFVRLPEVGEVAGERGAELSEETLRRAWEFALAEG